jgi:hypothetical protein
VYRIITLIKVLFPSSTLPAVAILKRPESYDFPPNLPKKVLSRDNIIILFYPPKRITPVLYFHLMNEAEPNYISIKIINPTCPFLKTI